MEHVHLSIRHAEVHALLGENGAGKSTLMKILSGVYQPDNGKILFNGKQVRFTNPLEAREAGIGIIFQEFSLIPDLRVYENIFLGRELKQRNGVLDTKRMIHIAAQKLEGLGVHVDPKATVRHLSIAEQQFVEIVKAVAVDIKVLILDEPTATLTPSEVTQLFKLMRELKSQGVAMIFISHHLEDVFEIADTVTCFRDGQYIGTKAVHETDVDELVHMMVGRVIDQAYPKKGDSTEIEQAPCFFHATVQRGRHSEPIELALRKGEILGISGLVGAGRTELIRALIGADKAYSKHVVYNGRELHLRSPADSLDAGIGLLPEDRKHQGLILPFSVQSNIIINTIKNNLIAHLIVNDRSAKRISETRVRELSIKTPSIRQKVVNLSGGNQQKVVIAKWLSTDCEILIFDEPTRGIDVGAKAEIYELMRTLSNEGLGIIMVSSEMPEIVGLSDRVLVMRSGAVVAELTGDGINPETIMGYASGGIK